MDGCVMWGCGKPIGKTLANMCEDHFKQWAVIKTGEWLAQSVRKLKEYKAQQEAA